MKFVKILALVATFVAAAPITQPATAETDSIIAPPRPYPKTVEEIYKKGHFKLADDEVGNGHLDKRTEPKEVYYPGSEVPGIYGALGNTPGPEIEHVERDEPKQLYSSLADEIYTEVAHKLDETYIKRDEPKQLYGKLANTIYKKVANKLEDSRENRDPEKRAKPEQAYPKTILTVYSDPRKCEREKRGEPKQLYSKIDAAIYKIAKNKVAEDDGVAKKGVSKQVYPGGSHAVYDSPIAE